MLFEHKYKLLCNNGIDKANTNCIVNGSAKVELRGQCRKEKFIINFKTAQERLKPKN